LYLADYKEAALSAPTGARRAKVAEQEDVGWKACRKISSARSVI
jgi:hypothetical protein